MCTRTVAHLLLLLFSAVGRTPHIVHGVAKLFKMVMGKVLFVGDSGVGQVSCDFSAGCLLSAGLLSVPPPVALLPLDSMSLPLTAPVALSPSSAATTNDADLFARVANLLEDQSPPDKR